jgi:hypothetical protein
MNRRDYATIVSTCGAARLWNRTCGLDRAGRTAMREGEAPTLPGHNDHRTNDHGGS